MSPHASQIVGNAPIAVIVFGLLYWLTLALLALLLRGRSHFTVANWWELGYSTPSRAATFATLLALMSLAGLPPLPTFFAKLGLLSSLYAKGGLGALVILLGCIGVGWLAYVGAALTLVSGSTTALRSHWAQISVSHGVALGVLMFAVVAASVGLADLTLVARWLVL